MIHNRLPKYRLMTAIALMATVLTLCIACSPISKEDYAKGHATIFCDEGFENVMAQEVEVFEYTYHEANIHVKYTSEVEAIDSLMAEKTRAIVVARELTPEQVKYLQNRDYIVHQSCIAVDAVALVANPKNDLSTLSLTDIRKIMRGEITTWRQLGYDNLDTIKIVFDHAGSSTVKYMRDKFLAKGENFPANAYAQNTSEQVLQFVKSDPDALGIISVSWLGADLSPTLNKPIEERVEDYKDNGEPTPASIFPDDIKVLKVSDDNNLDDISGYLPYQAYIFDGKYPLFRKIYMISTAPTKTLIHSFYTFITGIVGQKIILYSGIVPFNDQLRIVELK